MTASPDAAGQGALTESADRTDVFKLTRSRRRPAVPAILARCPPTGSDVHVAQREHQRGRRLLARRQRAGAGRDRRSDGVREPAPPVPVCRPGAGGAAPQRRCRPVRDAGVRYAARAGPAGNPRHGTPRLRRAAEQLARPGCGRHEARSATGLDRLSRRIGIFIPAKGGARHRGLHGDPGRKGSCRHLYAACAGCRAGQRIQPVPAGHRLSPYPDPPDVRDGGGELLRAGSQGEARRGRVRHGKR